MFLLLKFSVALQRYCVSLQRFNMALQRYCVALAMPVS
jgi:hypothetical protein